MVLNIFKKELKETLRDKRTLIVMIVIPALLFPLVFKFTNKVTSELTDEAQTKTLNVGYVGEENELIRFLKTEQKDEGKLVWKQVKDSSNLRSKVEAKELDLGLFVGEGFDESIKGNQSANVKLIYDATKLGYIDRLQTKIQLFNEQKTAERLAKLNIDRQVFNVLNVQELNVASDQEMIGKMAGGMLPYIFIIFGFIGCMYPAIDLFTGEKERGTIETLLTTPVARWQILAGKMGVVVLSGIMAAAFALGGLYYATQGLNTGSSSMTLALQGLFNFKSILLMFALVVPLIIFFAGMMIPITVYAKSFKEAQSIITPLNILVLVPAIVGMFPGIEYSWSNAFIPVINVVLATKEVIAGTIDYSLYFATLTSLLLLAVLAIAISQRQFGRESNVASN